MLRRDQGRGQGGVPRRGGRFGARRPIIALVGIDGSGKTTQARRLAAALRAAGVPATHWRNAGGRRFLGQVARLVGREDAQHLLGVRGLLVAESLLRWLAIARALLQSKVAGHAAIMDRYAVCQYASIRAHAVPEAGTREPGVPKPAARSTPGPPGPTLREFDVPEPAAREPHGPESAVRAPHGSATAKRRGGVPGRGERLARLAYRMFPAPDITFLLAVEPAEAYRRIEKRGTDHESLDYLTRARDAYLSLPEHGTFVVVDAGGSLDEVTREVLARLAGLALPGACPRPRAADVDAPAPGVQDLA